MSGSETDIQWFIARDGKQHGPVSDLELKKIAELAHLKPTDLVWRQGFTDWRAASSVFPELAASATPVAPSAPAASSPSPAASPTPAAKPASAGPTTTQSQPASSSPASPTQVSPTLGSAQRDSWRPQQGETTGRPAEPATASRTLGGPAQRTAGPLPAKPASPTPTFGTAARTTTDSRKPSELAAQPRQQVKEPSRARKLALVAGGLIAMTGLGAWISSRYTDDMFTYLQTDETSDLETGAAAGTPTVKAAAETKTAAAIPAAVTTTTTAPAATGSATAEDVDRGLQGRGMWVTIKQEFPDWYQARVADIARLSSEQKSQLEIDRYLANSLVTLRRENAKYALAASTTRHKELAQAFLANLNRLSQESGDECYDFISKGEQSSAIVERLGDPAKSTEIDAQILATVGAIVEGKKQPADHSAPVKTDYDVLAGELGRLGWTQADMQLFANPKALAQAPRARVCNMLKDWFTAHLAIQDPSTQERLLFETLKPVISG